MVKLFQKKDETSTRSVRRELRLTTEEDRQIREAAALRQLDVSDLIRRAALERINGPFLAQRPGHED